MKRLWNGIVEWWTRPGERRSTVRSADLPLAASYWTGGDSAACKVENISYAGALISAPYRWGLGTMLNLHLQHMPENPAPAAEPDSHLVQAVVVRNPPEGMALYFLLPDKKDRQKLMTFLDRIARNKEVRAEAQQPADEPKLAPEKRPSPLRRLPSRSVGETGGSLVEFGFMLPILAMLAINLVNFGTFFYAWVEVASAARGAAHYAAMEGAAVGRPVAPAAAQVATMVTADVSSLLNRNSLVVRACEMLPASTATCTTVGSGGGTLTNPATDTRTEATYYKTIWVDIVYQYRPVIPLFSFPGIHFYATIPPTRIHRQTVMRSIR